MLVTQWIKNNAKIQIEYIFLNSGHCNKTESSKEIEKTNLW